MPTLVFLAMTPGPAFVDQLRRAWDAGDAVLPVDVRLSPARQDELLRRFGAGVVVTDAGERQPVEGGGVPVAPGDALVVATSGTTGEPKGVVLTHQAVAAHARAASDRLAVDPAVDRWLACLPLAHMGGLGVVTRALLTGTPLVVHPGFAASAVEDEARKGATLVSVVPTALARGLDVSGFRQVLLGGAPALGPVPANVVCTWGLTETGGGIVYDGVPLDGVEVRVGENDDVEVRGPTVLRCYRDGTDPKDRDGWLPTGDAGGFDTDGRLSIHGRLDDVIVTGGENVWPATVEAALRRHPNVADVAVAGRPHPEWGEQVVAWVVAKGDEPTLDALRALVGEEVAPWAAPRDLIVVESLPRGPGGKVRRDRLSSPSR